MGLNIPQGVKDQFKAIQEHTFQTDTIQHYTVPLIVDSLNHKHYGAPVLVGDIANVCVQTVEDSSQVASYGLSGSESIRISASRELPLEPGHVVGWDNKLFTVVATPRQALHFLAFASIRK